MGVSSSLSSHQPQHGWISCLTSQALQIPINSPHLSTLKIWKSLVGFLYRCGSAPHVTISKLHICTNFPPCSAGMGEILLWEWAGQQPQEHQAVIWGWKGLTHSPHLPLHPGNSPALKNVPEQELSLAKRWHLLFSLDFLGKDGAVQLNCCLQTQALGTGSATALASLVSQFLSLEGSQTMGKPIVFCHWECWEVHPLSLPAFPALESRSVRACCGCCAWESPGHLSGLALLLTLHGCDYSPITKLEDYRHNNAQRNY